LYLHIILFHRFPFINLSQFPLFFIFPLLVCYNWHCASFQNFSHAYEMIFRLIGYLFLAFGNLIVAYQLRNPPVIDEGNEYPVDFYVAGGFLSMQSQVH